MKYEPISRAEASEVSLAGDFGLIFEAFADAFRGLSSSSEYEGRSSKIHFAAWR